MYELAQQKSAHAEVQNRTKQLDTNSKKKLMMICHYLWRALEDRSASEWPEGKIPQIEGSQFCR